MGFFDDFLNSKVAAEDKAILAKYPELAASVGKMETDLAAQTKFTAGWVNWQKENWDPESGMTKAERELQEELVTLRSNFSSAAAAGASGTELAAIRAEFDKKVKDVEASSLNAIQGMHNFYQTAATRIPTHQAEFGEVFNPTALMGYMQANGINDPDVAYDKMMAPKRAELAAANEKARAEKHALEITEAEARGAAKKATELAMGPNGMLPTDHTGGIAGVTSLPGAQKLNEDALAKAANAKLGDASLANLGYEMYRRGELPVQ